MGNYSCAITRQHRTAYVLLLDISGSMQDVIEYEGRILTKGECMVEAANIILQELLFRAYRDGEIRNYYDVAMIGYSGRGVYSMLESDELFVPITHFERDDIHKGSFKLKCLTPLNPPDELHGTRIVCSPEGYTPMYEALYITNELLNEWCNKIDNYDSSPPMVIHITDGHATDGDLNDIVYIAEQIMSLKTNDGNVLVINIHLSTMQESYKILFPTEREIAQHPSPFFRAMGRASSPMPSLFTPLIHEIRAERGDEVYRGVGFNVSVVDMISMMNIGTWSVPVR